MTRAIAHPSPRLTTPSNRRLECIWIALASIGLAGCGHPAVDTQPKPAVQADEPRAVSLHAAALAGDLDALRRALEAGPDLNRIDAYGSSPLVVAATFGRTEVARALIDAGADLALGNEQGSTPLHIAAFLGRVAIVEALLEHGADRYIRNNDGATAFDLVAAPFEQDRAIYDQLGAALAPFGLELDYDRIAAARPRIAAILNPLPAELATVEYRPLRRADWPVSTPEAQGLGPARVAQLYRDAAELESLRALLVVKGGHLVAERYFNDGSVDGKTLLQSVTKSVTSALVGLALERGCLLSLDQKMVEFFPELGDRLTDGRKREITIRQMLQMRAGFPWEETDSTLWKGLTGGDYLPLIVRFPLALDPGTGFEYSNVTSHLLAAIVARSCDTDLLAFARENLFAPIGVEPGQWLRDPYGYNYGHAELHLSARDLARFGLLYLRGGEIAGHRVLPAAWVDASLRSYSSDVSSAGVRSGALGRYFRDVGYGYQWWSARVGERHFNFAWGHGGQLVVLVPDLDMVVVVTSDPFHRPVRHDAEAWKHERANLNLVGKFIRSLGTTS